MSTLIHLFRALELFSKPVAQQIADDHFYCRSRPPSTSGDGVGDGGRDGGGGGNAGSPVAEEKSEPDSSGGYLEMRGNSPPNVEPAESSLRTDGESTMSGAAAVESDGQAAGATASSAEATRPKERCESVDFAGGRSGSSHFSTELCV